MKKSKSSEQTNTISVNEPPKIPTLSFGQKPRFGAQSRGPQVKSFILQTTRITQHRGGPSGGGGK